MMQDQLSGWSFALFFGGALAGVFALNMFIVWLSGWFDLQARFPDSGEGAERKLRMQAGRLGRGIYMSLALSATRTGLRVETSWFGMPFQRRFLVPWRHIRAEQRTRLLIDEVRLQLGDPEVGSLAIPARSWAKLADYSNEPRLLASVTPVERSRNAMGFAAQWAVVTAAAASFFYFVPRLDGHFGPPWFVCIGFPGLMFGIGQFFRFIREG